MALTLDQAISQGMNFGQWQDQLGLSQNPLSTSTAGGSTPWGQATNTWDQFRQDGVNNSNTMLASRPDLQAAGVNPMTYQAGNYGDGPAGYQLPTPPSGGQSRPGFQYDGTAAGPGVHPGDPSRGVDRPWMLPGGSTSAGGSGSSGGYGVSSNPYQGAQAEGITSRVMNDYLNPALQQINSGAVATGGLGGSRQGVAQGEAIAHGMDYLSGNLANLYGGNWNQDQNRALSQYGMDQNFYTAQRGQDQTGAALGGSLWNLGNQGAWTPLQNASNVYQPYTGFGQQTSSNSSGGGWQGAIGGAAGAAGFGHNMGWW